MRRRRRYALVATSIAALLGATVAVATASAHTATFVSQHTLGVSVTAVDAVFSGAVGSDQADCQNARAISLYRDDGDASIPDATVATDSTDWQGTWSTTVTSAGAGN